MKRLEKLKEISASIREPVREIPAEVVPQMKLENVITLSYPYEDKGGNNKWVSIHLQYYVPTYIHTYVRAAWCIVFAILLYNSCVQGAFKTTSAVEVNLPGHVAHRSLGLMELQACCLPTVYVYSHTHTTYMYMLVSWCMGYLI